ncbi:HIT family protein [Tunturiibacter empetritectus]|uniref:HIT family protein n=1 Tax=Tunturiibacter empetritectus TaxID=3069691 RepID=UPI003D9B8881
MQRVCAKPGKAQGTSLNRTRQPVRPHPQPEGALPPRYTRRMDRLWTPWRYSYITRSDPQAKSGVPEALSAWPPTEAQDKHCVFCNMIAAVDYAVDHGMDRLAAEKAAHIVWRGQTCFICLNAFPYSTGHLLLLPYQHLDTLAALPVEVAQELMALAQRSELALRQVYLPGGINMGLNLGRLRAPASPLTCTFTLCPDGAAIRTS